VELSGSILVVEDDAVLLETLAELLVEEGLEVQAVESGAAALKAVRAREFDVVLSDIKMPGMDGFELLQALKTIQPDARVILMTAFGSAAWVTKAMLGGALDYLSKPFSRDQLEAAIHRALID
jgi:DNA-binding NtrC family response regulator